MSSDSVDYKHFIHSHGVMFYSTVFGLALVSAYRTFFIKCQCRRRTKKATFPTAPLHIIMLIAITVASDC